MLTDAQLKEVQEMITGGNRKIVLFLGSGVNGALAPKWKELLATLLSVALNTRPESENLSQSERASLVKWVQQNLSPYEQANLVKQYIPNQYAILLKNALYSIVDGFPVHEWNNWNGKKPIPTKPFALLHAVASLCQDQRIMAVVSYNYDSFLEETLTKNCFTREFCSIFGARQQSIEPDELPIYHVHGYLPRLSVFRPVNEPEIILGREEYHKFALDSASWQASTQLYLLQHYTCIFIGTSLTDMNMLRMISHARLHGENRSAYVLMAKDGDVFQTSDQAPEKTTYESIENTVIDLLQTAHSDIGIHHLFFKEHEEIIDFINEYILPSLSGGKQNG